MSKNLQRLLSTPFGKELTPVEAQMLLDACATRELKAGTQLCQTGEPGDALFVLLEGSLDVVLGKPPAAVTVATISAGQIAGELELMTRSARVASLVAKEDCALLVLSAVKLEELLATNQSAANKLVLNVARTLARRLATVNGRILLKERPAAAKAPVPAAELQPIGDDDLQVLDKLWS